MEIERELKNLNSYYQESIGSPSIISDIKAMYKLPDEQSIIPFLYDN